MHYPTESIQSVQTCSLERTAVTCGESAASPNGGHHSASYGTSGVDIQYLKPAPTLPRWFLDQKQEVLQERVTGSIGFAIGNQSESVQIGRASNRCDRTQRLRILLSAGTRA